MHLKLISVHQEGCSGMNKKILVFIIVIIALLLLMGGLVSYALSDVEISSLSLTVQASSSMEPAISKGDIVIVEKNTEDIQVGDIIIYKPSWFPEPVLHRVISIKNES